MFILETDRLILRDWLVQDIEPFAAMNADPKVMEFMLKPLTLEETKSFINKNIQQFEEHDFGLFATVLKDTNEFIGYVGLSKPNFQTKFTPCVEIGWRLAYQYWGNGYATEAAKAVLKLAFEKYKLPEILSWTTPDNFRSRKIMEKLGMTNNPIDDFHHPSIPLNHLRSLHVLYRIKQQF